MHVYVFYYRTKLIMCVLIINHVTWNLCKCSVSGKTFLPSIILLWPAFFNILLLQLATGGGYNPKCLGCYYTCAVVYMWPMFVCTSSKNEWSVENVIRLCAFQPSTSCNVIMHVLTMCEVKLMQSRLMEQKHLYFWLLSPSVMLSKPLLISSY